MISNDITFLFLFPNFSAGTSQNSKAKNPYTIFAGAKAKFTKKTIAISLFEILYKSIIIIYDTRNDKYAGGKQEPILADISNNILQKFFVKNHISSLTYFMLALDLSIREYFNSDCFTYMNLYNGRYDERLMKTHGCFAKGLFR